MDTAKLSLAAVRLPWASRIDPREVRIRRRGRAIGHEPCLIHGLGSPVAGELDDHFVSADYGFRARIDTVKSL